MKLTQSKRNALASGAAFLCGPVAMLAATPYIFPKLGAEGYGLWTLANTLMASWGLASLGLSEAVVKYVAEARGLSDSGKVLRIARTAWFWYVLLGVLLGTSLYLSSGVLALWAGGEEQDMQARTAVALKWIAAGLAVRFMYSAVEGICRGFERYDLEAPVSAFASVGTVGAAYFSVRAGCGIEAILAGAVGMLAVGLAVLMGIVVWLTKSFSVLLPLPDWKETKRMVSFSIFTWMQAVGGFLFTQADRVIVTLFLGPAALGFYGVCLQFTQFAHGLLARAAGFAFPKTSGLFAAKDTAGLRQFFFRSMEMTVWVGTSISLGFYCFAEDILRLWLGEAPGCVVTTFRILAAANAIFATSVVPAYMLNGAGQVRAGTLFALLSGSLVAVSAWILTPAAGILGAAAARLCSLPVSIGSRVYLGRSVVQDSRWHFAVLPLAPCAVGFAAVSGIHWSGDSWILKGAFLLFGVAAAGVVSFFAFKSTEHE